MQPMQNVRLHVTNKHTTQMQRLGFWMPCEQRFKEYSSQRPNFQLPPICVSPLFPSFINSVPCKSSFSLRSWVYYWSCRSEAGDVVTADEHETDCISRHLCSYFSDPYTYLLLCSTTARHSREVSLRDKTVSQKSNVLLTCHFHQIAL